MAMNRLEDLSLIRHRLEHMTNAVFECYQTFGRDILVQTWNEKDSSDNQVVWHRLALDYYHMMDALPSKEKGQEKEEQNLYQLYRQERSRCQRLRKQALEAREKHAQLAQRIEEFTVVQWAKAMNGENLSLPDANNTGAGDVKDDKEKKPETPLPFEEALLKHVGSGNKTKEQLQWTEHLIQELNQLQSHQVTYQDLVQQENSCVEDAVRQEVKTLEGLEPLEGERIEHLHQVIWKRLVPASGRGESKAEGREDGEIVIPTELKQQVLSQKRSISASEASSNSGNRARTTSTSSLDDDFAKLEKKGKEVFANLFDTIKPTSSYEEGTATKEAQTFGFPGEVASLREQVKAKVVTMEETINRAKRMSDMLDGLHRTVMQLAQSLNSALIVTALGGDKHQRPPKTSLEQLTKEGVGPRSGELWGNFQMTVQMEIALVQALASTIKHLKISKLDNFLDSAQRDLKQEDETDDNNWKQLCQAASNATKALARDRQAQANLTKAQASVGDQTQEGNAAGQMGLGDAMKRFGNNAKQALSLIHI